MTTDLEAARACFKVCERLIEEDTLADANKTFIFGMYQTMRHILWHLEAQERWKRP